MPHREYYFMKYLSKYHDLTVYNKIFPWKKKRVIYFTDRKDAFRNVDVIEPNYYSSKNVFLHECINFVYDWSSLLQIIKRKEIDLVFNHDNPFLGYVILKTGLLQLYDFSDYLPEFATEKYFSDEKLVSLVSSIILKRLMNKSLVHSRVITSATLGLQHYAQAVGARQTYLLSNFVDCDFFKPRNGSEIRKKYDLDGMTLGYAGSVWKNTKLVNLIRGLSIVAKNYRDIKLLIIGDGKMDFLAQISRKYRMEGDIIFGGHVPYGEVPTYINAMDVCFLGGQSTTSFTWQAGRPRKLFEYMACAKPIVSPPSFELNALFSSFENKMRPILFASKPEDIAKKIILLKEDQDLRTKLGKIARCYVCQNFHWHIIANQLREIIENLDV